MGVVSAVFWGVVVLSLLVFLHEGGHFLAARACGMRVTEFYLGMPCRHHIARKSRTYGTEFGVTPILLGGYTRICGMEGTHDDLLPACFGIVQREGRVLATDVAAELGVDADRAYDMLATLADWAAIRPYYDAEKGEAPSQSTLPEAFETLRRDPNMLTEYDAGHDFSLPGTTDAGEPRPLEDPAKALASEKSRTYLGKGFLKRVFTLVAGPLVNIVLAFLIVTASLSIVGVNVAVNSNRLGAVTKGSAAQAAGRLESKRVMKDAAYAELFEMMFKYAIAYSDEPRSVTYKDSRGETVYEEFNRYDFLEQDADGGWHWNDQFLFSCDTSAPLASNREAMWKETRQNLQTGAFGDPGQTETLILFWSKMEELHYPGAASTKKYLEEKLSREQQMQAVQQAEQQARQDALNEVNTRTRV